MNHYTCPLCQKQFSHEKKNRKYCGSSCQNKASKRPEDFYTCFLCNKKFNSKQHKPKYCSRTCFNLRRTNSLWVSRQETKNDCLFCGVSFNYIKRQKRKFCSFSCYIDFNNKPQEQLHRLKKCLDRWTKKTEMGCWEWQGSKNRSGYGSLQFKGKFLSAHRAAWIVVYGDNISSSDFICHTCDNRTCVNIAHLWLGNAKENAIDMTKKGRSSGVLSIDQVKEIKKRLKEGQSGYSLAREYNVNKSSIYSIKHGRNWNNVN